MNTRFLLLLLCILAWAGHPRSPHAQSVHWQRTNFDVNTRVNALLADSNGILLAGTKGFLYKTNNSGEQWRLSGPAKVQALTTTPSGFVFAAGKLGVHRSADKGDSWVEVQPPTFVDLCDSNGAGFGSIAAGQDGSIVTTEVFYTSSVPCKVAGVVQRSSDLGATWLARFGVDVPTTVTFGRNGTVYVGTTGGVVLTPTDNGIPWDWRYHPGGSTFPWNGSTPNAGTVRSIQVNAEGHLFAGIGRLNPSHVGFGQSGTGVYRSVDGGSTWERLGPVPEEGSVTAMVIRPDGQIFIGTEDRGVFRLRDGEENWEPLNGGLTSLSVTALAVSPEGVVYIATEKGILRSTSLIGTPVEPEVGVPGAFSLDQNYPNPFKPTTRITFDLPESSSVSLKVYDVQGREVALLVSEYYPAGRFEVVWNPLDYPSGVYMYRLEAGASIQARTMVLQR